MENKSLELYAIRFAKHFKYGTRNTVFLKCDRPNECVEEFEFFYYMAVRNGKYIMFDVGFREKEFAESMDITILPVEEEIQRIWGNDLKIDTVVLTHSHWDHVNNLDLYPNANIIVSEEGYNAIFEECKLPSVLQILTKGNVTQVRNQRRIDDYFLFEVIGGHSRGSSVIRFTEKGCEYVLTGDECYSCDNILHNIPIGIYADTKKNQQFIQQAHNERWIPLPCHDGRIMEQYERITENIVRII